MEQKGKGRETVKFWPWLVIDLLVLPFLLLVIGCSANSTVPDQLTTKRLLMSALQGTPIATVPPASPAPTDTRLPTLLPTATQTASPQPTHTPTPGPPPHLVASYPIDQDRAVPSDRPLQLVFDLPMDPASVASHITISPAIEFELTWPSPNQLLLQPRGGWPSPQDWTLSLTPGVCATHGALLENPIRLSFSTGGNRVPIPVLMYHHVLELEKDASEGMRTWTVSPEAFREQLEYLEQNGWHSISARDLADYLLEGTPLPPQPIVITIDDGNADLYRVAFPILKETRLRPVLFIVPTYMGYGAYIDWPQLKEMVEAGFYVGSHSYDHPDLRKLSDAELKRQILESRQILEDHLGIEIDAFCYPFGAYDQRTIDLLAAHGYRTGFTLNPLPYQDPSDPFRINRLRISYEMDLEDFIAILPD